MSVQVRGDSSLGGKLYDGAERGPVDRDGTRGKKSKHSSYKFNLRPESKHRQVCLAVEAFPLP